MYVCIMYYVYNIKHLSYFSERYFPKTFSLLPFIPQNKKSYHTL